MLGRVREGAHAGPRAGGGLPGLELLGLARAQLDLVALGREALPERLRHFAAAEDADAHGPGRAGEALVGGG